MAKCFFTGVEVPLKEAYVLDKGPAFRLLNDLKQRTATLERLIQQLVPRDAIEVFDPRKREIVMKTQKRLISPSVAETLANVSPQTPLFNKWSEWKPRRFDPGNKGDTGKTDHESCGP